YDVDWGDGTVETGFTGDASHTYTNARVHIVSISGDFPRIYFNNGGDKDKIQTIEQWGDIEWLSMRLAFFGCSNLTYNATDAPNLTNVTSLFAMFFDASSFDGEVGNWDVSNINDMQSLFGNTAFNQDISNWDVSNVTNLSQTFFNTPFNQDIGEWDVSNVTTMQNLFLNASDFNQDISNWDVSKVENFTATFSNASSFNADLSSWNVGLSTNMENMFAGAGSFNQDLSNWDIADVTNMTSMLNSSGLSTVNYDKILQGWATQTVQPNVTLGALNIDYCLGSTARNTLLAGPNNWTINDGNENCVVNIPDANFKAALLANGTINTDGDPTEISYQEAEVVNNLQLAGLNISDLTGIEAFTALNVLAANNNNLTSIDLSNNESLDYLSLSGNDLIEIDLSNNPTLIEIILSNNQLTEIDLSNNGQITTLWVDQNDISSIDLSNNLLLEDLRVDRNANLSSLNISANDQLTDLHAYSCNLQNINVSSNTLLQKLFLYANDIISLDLSGLSDLDDLRVGGLSITNLDLSDSPNLRFLRASGMGLTELTLAGTNLVQLFIGDNNLNGSLDLSIYPNLTNVRIEQNNFTDVDLRNGNNGAITNFNTTDNPNLTCISVDNVTFAEANFTSKDSQTLFSTNCSNVANDITAFSFSEQASAAIIGSGTIDIEVALGTDLSSLSPTFTVSSGATADPASGVAQDFSNSFVYTVTAENPTAVQQWTINVLEENVAPTDIILGNASIDENNAIAAVIGTLSTTDGNTADTHSYSLVAGTGDTDNASFDISGSNLIASEVFDFETKTSYSVRVQTNDGRGGTFEKEFAISINDISGQSQAITIAPIIDKLITDEPFGIEASASSGLVLTYGISGPATLNGTTVTLDGTAGTVTITVAQAGNEDYLSAEEQVTFDVLETQAAQNITFNAIEDQFLIDESLSLTATASSGLDVTYEIVSGPATVSGNIVTFTGLGTVTVKASQAGSSAFLAATPVEQSFEIVQTSQSITFEAIDDQLFSNGSLTLEATASSGLDVTYDIVSGPATVSGNVVSFTDLGMVTVSASQAGNEAFTAAAVVEQSFTIFKNEQTITFNTIDDQFFEAGSITLSATASSGLEVSYDIVSGPATITGNVISFSDLGTVVVSANQVGNDSFLAAAAVEQAFDVITVTGVDDVTSALLIYPNPASDVLTIQTQQEDVSIQLLNMTGVKVMNIRANAPNNISHLNDGIYFLRISIGENYTTHKIIKK
uniref:BspA family leucine-rich repeat surface protein n=1 Tax=Fulvivirga sp. TaxID=1931237 RepID=UPI00404B48DF